jgi:hypothetical protein
MDILPAVEAMWLAVDRYVLVSCQGSVTHIATEMLQMPVLILGSCVFGGKYEFITSCASWYVHHSSKISSTVQFSLAVEVKKVFQ